MGRGEEEEGRARRREQRREETSSEEEAGRRRHRPAMMMMMMMMMEPPEQHDGRTTDNRGHQPPVRHIILPLLTTTYARVGNPDGRLSSAYYNNVIPANRSGVWRCVECSRPGGGYQICVCPSPPKEV